MEPLLCVTGLTKRFGALPALSGVSFEVTAGEVVGLIGPNGAGKTTLINLVTGALRPTAGTIQFAGTDITGRRPHHIGRIGIARTFQIVRPFANLTVLENVAVGAMYGTGGRGRSASEAKRRADDVLGIVGLSARRDDLAESLPIGDRKRLELAKAVAMEPQLLLLDEAMAGLRGAEIDQAMAVVRAVRDRGVTLLVVEHVMKVILGLCTRIVVLDSGRKIAEGSPNAVTRDPAVVAAYLGARYASAPSEPGP